MKENETTGHIPIWGRTEILHMGVLWRKKNEDERPPGKPKHRWKNNIKVELKETARILLAEWRDQ